MMPPDHSLGTYHALAESFVKVMRLYTNTVEIYCDLAQMSIRQQAESQNKFLKEAVSIISNYYSNLQISGSLSENLKILDCSRI